MTATTSPSTFLKVTPSPAVLFIKDYLAVCKTHGYVVSKSNLEFCEPCDELDDEVALAVRMLVESRDSLAGMETECAALLANRTYLPFYALAAVMRLLGEAKCRELVSTQDYGWFFSQLDQHQ
ncbi:hypothetical protein [Burkholderia sp. Bp9142]|uniref:hypothetical protein n=1 Tax=Burkholderia sp. Bp9142 TaxID=2184573 RepID=UPI000F59543D|nr:hypothetical protein [Burkholderia sp. Bp9142]RQR34814.1 hypothetical protein DIE22_16125 [Burkholderia sp. Bp9142]